MMNKIKLPEYSVTMSVYEKENPVFLYNSIYSILNQTHKTDDFVIVCDGALTPELDEILDDAEKLHPSVIHIIRLDEHVGTAKAANIALNACRHELVGKMDSDDISLPDRFEKQLRRIAKFPELDIIGTYIEEFLSDTDEAIAVRKTPLSNKAIHEFAKQRNPFNNQTLLFKKSVALSAGGYSEELKRCEDYDFVVKMLANGAVAGNIPQVLVKYRVTKENYQRRRNWANTKAFIKVRWRIHKSGYSSMSDFVIPCLMQITLFALPAKFTGFIYKKAMR